MPGVSFQSRLDAVGQPDKVETLADMRGADARSWQIERPAGVAFAFQVRENNVEPRPSKRVRNLLSKDDRGGGTLG